MIDQLSAIALRATSFLAAPPTPPPGKGPEWGKAAPMGLLVILLLCVGVWLLMRSMSKHLRKVQEQAQQDQVEPGAVAGVADESAAATDPGLPGTTGTATATVGGAEDPRSSGAGTPATADPST